MNLSVTIDSKTCLGGRHFDAVVGLVGRLHRLRYCAGGADAVTDREREQAASVLLRLLIAECRDDAHTTLRQQLAAVSADLSPAQVTP